MSSPGSHQDGGGNESEQSVVKIDPDGDLTLVVGKTRTRFLVCSKALSRSAPFWKRCLYGPFKEARPAIGQDWVVEFPEDNPSGLKYLLLLVHGLGHEMPKIDLQLAFEITVLTNKYDMTRLLWAVAEAWLKDLKPIVLDDDSDDTIVTQLQWLWVTKELGASDQHCQTFVELSQKVTMSTDGDDRLLIRHFEIRNADSLTRDTLEGYDSEKDVILLLAGEIKTAREKAISEIQNVLQMSITELQDDIRAFESPNARTGASICRGRKVDGSMVRPNKRKLCEYAMQAILTKVSANENSVLRPIEKIAMSVSNFRSFADSFAFRVGGQARSLVGPKHRQCTPFTTRLPSLEELKQKTLSAWYEENIDAFKTQARLSGLDKGCGEHDETDQDSLGSNTAARKRSRDEFEHLLGPVSVSEDSDDSL